MNGHKVLPHERVWPGVSNSGITRIPSMRARSITLFMSCIFNVPALSSDFNLIGHTTAAVNHTSHSCHWSVNSRCGPHFTLLPLTFCRYIKLRERHTRIRSVECRETKRTLSKRHSLIHPRLYPPLDLGLHKSYPHADFPNALRCWRYYYTRLGIKRANELTSWS